MTLFRVEIIQTAKERVGPSAFKLNLNRVYDDILIGITEKYPLLKNQVLTGTTVSAQTYQNETFPPNYRMDDSNELMICNENRLTYMEPEEYFYKVGTEISQSDSEPSNYTIDIGNSKIYFWPTPDSTYAYNFYHTIIHPRAGRFVSFTSGGTYITRPGVTMTGATSAATGVVSYVKLTSGTWAVGTAAGTFYFSSQTGTFSSENLNVGSDTNVATIAANSTVEDSFEHFLGTSFDEAIIKGVMAKAFDLTDPPQAEKARYWEIQFWNDVDTKSILKVSKRATAEANFWVPGW